MSVMRRFAGVIAVVLALAATLAVAHASTSATITAAQLTTRFKQSTGDKLLPNKNASYAGHYKAYDRGPPSIANKGKYGIFTVYLVAGGDVEADLTDLLADAHTGVLGKPGPGNIYWEEGKTIHGDEYWLAKRRYGENVVLWWIGSKAVKKTDKTFKRLHTTLTKAVA